MKRILALILLTNSVNATQTWWLNIPGYIDKDGIPIPSLSLPTSDHDKCSDAVINYAKNEYVYYISCDIKPLPDAVNLGYS